MAPAIECSFATEDDIPELARVGIEALQSDLVRRLFFTKALDRNRGEANLATTLRRQLTNPTGVVVKAKLCDGGKAVGYLWAYRVDNPSAERDGLSFSAKGSLGFEYEALVRKTMGKAMGGQRHWVGRQLMVLPAYQRQGIGRTLITWTVERVDTEALPVCINGSLSGATLYHKMGWKPVDSITVGDATAEGPGSEGYLSQCMVTVFHQDFETKSGT